MHYTFRIYHLSILPFFDTPCIPAPHCVVFCLRIVSYPHHNDGIFFLQSFSIFSDIIPNNCLLVHLLIHLHWLAHIHLPHKVLYQIAASSRHLILFHSLLSHVLHVLYSVKACSNDHHLYRSNLLWKAPVFPVIHLLHVPS